MAKDNKSDSSAPETVISIIGPGMKVVGDCETDGTVRVEGLVEGSVNAGKAVVVGKDGKVEGTVDTQDAVISGAVSGTVTAESRLELQATARIDGDIFARRMQLEEGALVNGKVHMGEEVTKKSSEGTASGAAASPGGSSEGPGAPGEEAAESPSGSEGGEEEGRGFGFSRRSGEERPSKG